MKKLDWYIISKFLGTFVFTIILFSVVAVVIDVSERIDDFLENEAPLRLIIFDYYLNFIPYIVFFLSPLFIFIAIIFFTSKLAYRSEIVAILASGVSFYRLLLVPYFISAALLVGVQLYANHFLVPNSNKTRLDFENTYIRNRYVNKDKNIHLQIDTNTYIYMESYSSRDSSGQKFTLEKINDKQLFYKLSAKKIKWNEKKQEWTLTNFSARNLDNLKENLREGKKMDTLLNFHPIDFSRRVNFKEAMNTPELTAFIDRERKKGAPLLQFYEVEKHRRTAIPFGTFILTIIGLSIASRKVRGGMGFHIFLGITISAGYILFLQVSTTFATNGNLSPMLSVWIPNIIVGIISIVLMIKAPK